MPENTFIGYQHSIDVGADAIEGNVHATKDGVVVVSHDATVTRCTNGTGKIKDYSFKEQTMIWLKDNLQVGGIMTDDPFLLQSVIDAESL